MTKIDMNIGKMGNEKCGQCAHHQCEKTHAIAIQMSGKTLVDHLTLNNFGAGICTNCDSDHYGHVTADYHPACEKALIQ